jgi:hypothetical protein
MMGISTKTIRLIVTALLLVCPAALAAGILPDADFADANPKANVDDGWRWDTILPPGDVAVNADRSITLTGRKGFLHSPFFPTGRDSALSYEISAEISGTGTVQAAAVWWDAERMPVSPHVEHIIEQTLTKRPTRITAVAHPGGGRHDHNQRVGWTAIGPGENLIPS